MRKPWRKAVPAESTGNGYGGDLSETAASGGGMTPKVSGGGASPAADGQSDDMTPYQAAQEPTSTKLYDRTKAEIPAKKSSKRMRSPLYDKD